MVAGHGAVAPVTLGIETSCDETAVAILDGEGAVQLNLVSSQVAVHAPYLGVVPELASRRHLEVLPGLLSEAERRVGLGSVELVAVTRGPGLIGALLVGTSFAAAYAWARGVKLVGVDHLEGHLVSPFISLDGQPAAVLPERVLTLVVSGGHTSCFLMAGGEVRALNRTRDDAAGEVFDKVAAALGLPYPGGPVIDRLAEGGDPHAFTFHPPRIKDPSGALDYSFSGLKTATIRTAAELGGVPLADPAHPPQRLLDLLASFRDTVVTWLLAPLPELVDRYRPQVLAMSGGVAANAELRRRLPALGESLGLPTLVPPVPLTTDNAAMIARAGQLKALAGRLDDPFALRAYPRAPFKGGADARGRPTFPPLV
ncbi:MAG: tRNA (adenosine(37)-N6)-threonylcarbamoyltransferase complex transferase subunit TsaD [Acidobacteriota bacterium]|jgi:N6-L-threonylcarbamoyladenine synthase